ncbi:MAG: outer membrane beta-barrel protein [Mariniblastus sp.]
MLQGARQLPTPQQFNPNTGAPFQQRVRTGNVGYRRIQDNDPFGDPVPGAQGGNPAKPSNAFDPFADPPAEAPKSQQPMNDPFGDPIPSTPKQDPFGDAPAQSPFGDPPKQDPFGDPPTTTPRTQPRNVNPKVDPFADPPAQQNPILDRTPTPMEQQGQDPVLPEDAQFNPNPNQDRTQDPTPAIRNPDVDLPPDSVAPGDPPQQIPSDPFKDPVKDTEPRERNQLLPPDYIPPSGIYKAPPNQNMPPIVQPGTVAPPYQMAPRSYPQPGDPYVSPGYQTQPGYQQGYQPAYQPIPGMVTQPGYAPQANQQQYAQPGYQQQQPMQPLYAGPPSVAPAADVYTEVIGDTPTVCNDSGCPNFYFGLFGGISMLRDIDATTGAGMLSTDDGSIFGASLGRRNGRNLRSEIEFSYRQNDITGFTSPLAPIALQGDVKSYAGMANAYWEFIDVPTRFLKPYIGTGIGFVSFDPEISTPGGASLIPTGAENDTSFAFQYMAGINYKAYRNMDLYAEYRFFEADGFRVDASPEISGNYDLKSDNVLFGLRWKF